MIRHVTFLSEGKALCKPKEWCWLRLWEQERQAHTPDRYLFFQVPGDIKSSSFRTGGPSVAQLPPCRRYVSLRNWQMGGSALVSITGKWHRSRSSCVSLSKWESIWLSVCVFSSRSSWSPYFWTHRASSWMTNDQDRPHHSVHIALQCLSHDEYFLVDGHEHVTLKIPSHFMLLLCIYLHASLYFPCLCLWFFLGPWPTGQGIDHCLKVCISSPPGPLLPPWQWSFSHWEEFPALQFVYALFSYTFRVSESHTGKGVPLQQDTSPGHCWWLLNSWATTVCQRVLWHSSCLLNRTDCVSLSSGKQVPSRNYKYKSLIKGKSLKKKKRVVGGSRGSLQTARLIIHLWKEVA